MKKLLAVVFLASICFSAGCAQYWYQGGKTFEECRQDQRACLEELKKYSSNWRKMGNYEFEFMENCMRSKGYSLVREKELPLRVKRQDPDRMLHARLKGIAGTVD